MHNKSNQFALRAGRSKLRLCLRRYRLAQPNQEIDTIWAKEAEARIDAHENGELETVSIADVFGKYDKSWKSLFLSSPSKS